MKPIKSVTLIDTYDNTPGNDIHINTLATINKENDLVIDGCDGGERIKKFWGDWDYEYWTTVKQEYKDTVLLLLIKDNFKDDFQFRKWLKKHEIPFEFSNWV